MQTSAVARGGQNGEGGKMSRRFELRTTVGLAALLLAVAAPAQQQQSGVCAPVKIQILQQLTLERVGFLATLTITDNTANNPITDFAANLTFENPLLSTRSEEHTSELQSL